jgi:ankyrin repeat protein
MPEVHPATDDCWKACYHDGDIEKVKSFLADGVNINDRAPCSGACPLDAAIHGNHDDLAKFLIEQGADLNGYGYGGGTPLTAAANYQNIEMLKTLLTAGADPNYPAEGTGDTPLHAAATQGAAQGSTECVQILLEAGANPNRKTNVDVESNRYVGGTVRTAGETPLHLAAAYGDEEMIKLLLDAGADKSATDAHGLTALNWYGRHQRKRPQVQIQSRELADSLRPDSPDAKG